MAVPWELGYVPSTGTARDKGPPRGSHPEEPGFGQALSQEGSHLGFLKGSRSLEPGLCPSPPSRCTPAVSCSYFYHRSSSPLGFLSAPALSKAPSSPWSPWEARAAPSAPQQGNLPGRDQRLRVPPGLAEQGTCPLAPLGTVPGSSGAAPSWGIHLPSAWTARTASCWGGGIALCLRATALMFNFRL